MKRISCRILSMLLIVALLSTLLAACGGGTKTAETTAPADTGDTAAPANSGEVYQFSLTMHDPATSTKGKLNQEWCDQIKEATNGQVEITLYGGGSLAAADAALDSVRTRAVDIGWVFSSFNPGQFPLSDVVTLPMLGSETTMQSTKTLWDLFDWSPALQEEFSEYKLLHMYTNPQNFACTANKPIDSLDSINGLKFRTPAGAIADIMTLWGAVPIMMGPGDVYESIEKGVIDGFTFEWSGINAFKLQELTKYIMDLNIFCGPFFLLMNKDVWNSLPADLQAIVDENSGRDKSLYIAEKFQQENDDVRAAAIAGGTTVCEVSQANYDAFKSIADKYRGEWAAKHTTADLDAQAYLDKTLELMAANA